MTEKLWIKDKTDSELIQYVPTGMYYVRKKKKGKKDLFKSTGNTSKTKAKTKAALIIAEWLGRARGVDAPAILFGEFAESFLEYVQKTKLRPRTKEQASIFIPVLIEEIGHMDIRAINEGYFDEWLADFRTRAGYSVTKKSGETLFIPRTTFSDYAKYLGKTLRHAYRKGLIDRLPEFKANDPAARAGRIYTPDEIRALMDAASPRLELQIRLCYQGFMRLREMLFLTWDRVNLATGLIRLEVGDVKTGTATGKGREFFVNEEVLSLLRIQRRGVPAAGPYVFPSPQDPLRPTWNNRSAWRRTKAKAGIQGKATWHSLRHTALTRALIEMEMNPLKVSKYAGVSIRTIERVYLHVRPEDTRDVGRCIEV